MGEKLSKAVQPEELAVFKKLPTHTLLDNIEIPERAENRRRTDSKFFIIFIVCVAFLVPFLIYTMINSDIGRLFGYDQCGNVCGQKNSKYNQWDCTGEDFTDKKYLQYEATSTEVDAMSIGSLLTRRKCVAHCDYGYKLFLKSCYKEESPDRYYGRQNDYENEHTTSIDVDAIGSEISSDLNKSAWRITLACFLSLGVTLGMLFLFRTATAAVVWGILGGVVLFGTIVVGGFWYLYFSADNLTDSQSRKQDKQGLLVFCIFFTIALLVLFCVMVFMYKKVQLVILLLKETTKAAFAMPLMIFTPIITFLAILVIVGLLVFNTALMTTSGTLTELKEGYLYYKENPVMIFTIAFNFWMAFWAIQFIVGIQYMIIAGAVSKWYFAKNKNNLVSPISTSAGITFKFHLGSIAFGSLVITLIAIIRALLSSLTKNKNLKACTDFCMGSIETFLKFLSKNSYILTAMHGKPFYKSGKRAAKIIFQNAVNITAVNYVGDFVLGMAQLLIVLISMLLTYIVMQGSDGKMDWAVYLIVFFVSLVTAVTFFSVFETTIDTVFLCFCEDSLLNDGMARPYAMSRDLMEFVENSKKVYGDKN